jgi:hypothetical protein
MQELKDPVFNIAEGICMECNNIKELIIESWTAASLLKRLKR